MLANLKDMRLSLHMTQQQVANKLGLTRQAYSNYESGLREPEYATLCALADLFQCPVGRLMGRVSEYENGARIPILGTVKGGFNRMAQEELEGYEVADVANPDEYFFLRVTGDSMAPQIQEGDLALVHSQESLLSGEVGVVLLEDDEATIKRVVFSDKSVILQPFNNAYTPVVLRGGECRILGRVVRTIREW
jgi:repressor LexA